MKQISLETNDAWFLVEELYKDLEAIKERNSKISVDIEHQIRLEKLLNNIRSQIDK